MAFVAADPGCDGGLFMLPSNGIEHSKTPSKVPSDMAELKGPTERSDIPRSTAASRVVCFSMKWWTKAFSSH